MGCNCSQDYRLQLVSWGRAGPRRKGTHISVFAQGWLLRLCCDSSELPVTVLGRFAAACTLHLSGAMESDGLESRGLISTQGAGRFAATTAPPLNSVLAARPAELRRFIAFKDELLHLASLLHALALQHLRWAGGRADFFPRAYPLRRAARCLAQRGLA